MIIVNLKGGLGNQLFQYAFGKSISKKFSKKFYIDNSAYLGSLKIKKRDLWTDKFNLSFDGYYKNFKNVKIKTIINHIKSKANFLLKNKIYIENFYHYDPNIFKLDYRNNNYYFDGYWQSYKYFLENLIEIKNELNLNQHLNIDKNLLEEISKDNNLSMHIRGGDYRYKPFINFNGLLSSDYYNYCYDEIKKKINIKKVFVFTDDIEYLLQLSKNFKFKYDIISSRYTVSDIEDLALFSKSKNKIISNSTFAWWAAILSDNIKIYYPAKWFAIQYNNTKDLFPPSWNKI